MTCAEPIRREGAARALACALLFAGLSAGAAPEAVAQGYRGWVGTTVQAVELRPLGLDTVPRSQLVDDGGGGFTYQGAPARCRSLTVCTVYAPADKALTVAATQDVSLTAWGFGIQGLSFTGLVRGRARAGGDVVWPRSGDEFDAILGYAQLVRGRLQARLGRQEIRSGLGFPAFDGVSATVRAAGGLDLEGYAGRSLARGLREPANEALRGLESFLVDKSAYLVGGSARARYFGTSLTGRYQREILSDRSGLLSERASLDVEVTAPAGRMAGALDYDFGFGTLGKGHVTFTRPLAESRWLLEVGGARYVPYFDLSTIWGYFQPVSYHEVRAGVGWSPSGNLGVRLSGGWRSYGDTETIVVLEPGKSDGWRAEAGVRWQPEPDWAVDGGYRLEWGPGGFLSTADASARYRSSERLGVTGTLTTFQQIEELRLGDGRAFGGGVSFDLGMTERATLAGGVFVLRHRDGGTPGLAPWSQSRAWTSLRIEVGSDPALAARRSR